MVNPLPPPPKKKKTLSGYNFFKIIFRPSGQKKMTAFHFSVGLAAAMCPHTRENKSAKVVALLAVFSITYLQN
jgi:hypothetical protein